VSVAIIIQHAMRVRHIVTEGLPRSTVVFCIIIRHDYRKNLSNI